VADRFPGVFRRGRVSTCNALKQQSAKEGYEIDQGLFIGHVLADPDRGLHRVHAMLRPKREALGKLAGAVDLGEVRVERSVIPIWKRSVAAWHPATRQEFAAYLELIFACDDAGAVAAPINWRLTASEVRSIIEDIKPKLVFTGAEFKANGAAAGICTLTFNELQGGGEDPKLDRDGAVSTQFCTSGTTRSAVPTTAPSMSSWYRYVTERLSGAFCNAVRRFVF
jgi:acyl-CoA synthetase (AMP-forming)/AMP-acid ligase II